MFLKILSTASLIIPLVKGIKKIWKTSKATTSQKVLLTITAIAPLIIGIHHTWKNKVE